MLSPRVVGWRDPQRGVGKPSADCLRSCRESEDPEAAVQTHFLAEDHGRALDEGRLAVQDHLESPQRPLSLGRPSGSEQRVLWFAPVGAKFMNVTALNIAHLRKFPVDVFLAHYDGTTEQWRRNDWYDSSVKFSVDYPAAKADFVHRELVHQEHFNTSGYQWYWVADDNIDFTGMNIWEYMKLADESKAWIVQPAVNDLNPGLRSFELVNVFRTNLPGAGHCRYRLTDFVEVMSPMFRPEALAYAYDLHLSGSVTDWGMDQVWCRYVAAKLQHAPDKACAIIDSTPMLKLAHGHSYSVYLGLLDDARVHERFRNFSQLSLDRFMRRRSGETEWCQPTQADAGLVRLNFTGTDGLIATADSGMTWQMRDYPTEWFLTEENFVNAGRVTESFLMYHKGVITGLALGMLLSGLFYLRFLDPQCVEDSSPP